MRQWIRSHLTYANVMVTILAFIVLGGMSYAATGGNFILGQANTASSTTSLTRTGANTAKGLQVTNTSTGAGATALGLSVASGHAPFTVNSGTKVTNLNADKLDGINSTGFLSSGSVKKLSFEAATGSGEPTLATVGPFTIKGQCADLMGTTALRLIVNGPSGTSDYLYTEALNDSTFTQHSGQSSLSGIGDSFVVPELAVSGPTDVKRAAGTAMLKWIPTGDTDPRVVQVDFNGVADLSSCHLYGTATMGT
jgi:hypothetical protein